MTPVAVAVLVVLAAVAALRYRRRANLARAMGSVGTGWGRAAPPRAPDEHADEYARFAADEWPSAPRVDDRTWADLDAVTVIATVDRTITTLGRQVLCQRIREGAHRGRDDALEQLSLVFADNASARSLAQRALIELGAATGQSYWGIVRPSPAPLRAWYVLFPILGASSAILLALVVVWPAALLGLVGVLFANLWMRAVTNARALGFLGAFRQVGPVLRAADRLSQIPAVAALAGVDRVRADIADLRGLNGIARWAGRDLSSANEIAGLAIEFVNLLFLVDANAMYLGARGLERHRLTLASVSAWTGLVDAALNVASLRAEARPWCTPARDAPDAKTTIRGAWHPMVEQPAANAIELSPGRGIVITGSNMSGKSTYLRTAGVCALLANGLNTCPAESYSGPALRVHSCIGRADDLAGGKSYYLAEVEAVLAIVRASSAGEHSLLLFDELFRGTNTVERLAAGEAVVRALLGSGAAAGASVIVATHDAELVTMLADVCDARHFRETIAVDGLSFDYVLRDGPATTRSAITLLELNGAPAGLVAAARARAAALDAARAPR